MRILIVLMLAGAAWGQEVHTETSRSGGVPKNPITFDGNTFVVLDKEFATKESFLLAQATKQYPSNPVTHSPEHNKAEAVRISRNEKEDAELRKDAEEYLAEGRFVQPFLAWEKSYRRDAQAPKPEAHDVTIDKGRIDGVTPDNRDATIASQAALIKWQEEEIATLKNKIQALAQFWQLEVQSIQHQASKPVVEPAKPKQ